MLDGGSGDTHAYTCTFSRVKIKRVGLVPSLSQLSDLEPHYCTSVTDLGLLLINSSLSTMILYLLLPVLILGTVDPKTANVTEEELNKVEGNQTFSESNTFNSTNNARNVTFSLDNDEKSRIEDELQSNKTFTNITEDNEHFQEQEIEFPARHCKQHLLVELSHGFCGDNFHKEMQSIGTENWCILEKIIRPYNSLTDCLEKLSPLVGCYYPNPNIQDFFLDIHSYYFHNCSMEEMLFSDAPHGLVIALTLIPVSLIPVLVYLVVWKSKIQK